MTSNIYAALQVSPKKKRCPPELDDGKTSTPKKLRIAPLQISDNSSRQTEQVELPAHLVRLDKIQTALQHAISHALATCAVSPTSDTGIIRNVLNHMSLTTYTGLTTQFHVNDLSRLCWIWEWDGKSLPVEKKRIETTDTDDNPFLVNSSPATTTPTGEWTRGAMGFVLSPTTHHSKQERKRVSVYGIGIEVEMDIDKDMGGGMAAVARWTAASETRRSKFRDKLERWVKLHMDVSPIPYIPLAGLPELAVTSKVSTLTRTLASSSPKPSLASASLPDPSSSPTKSPIKSPTKRALREFAIPFPTTPSKSPTKNSILFPKTPSRHTEATVPSTPRTPVTSITSSSIFDPSTPVHQKGSEAQTVPQTPTSSRRQALYERVRQRSLSASPTKVSISEVTGGRLTRDQISKMEQDEMRRRCLLGRLGGVAESVWMLFSTPVIGSSTTNTARKRRALPTSEVVTAIIKSSPVPISSAEANDSISMLTKLCPFFVKGLSIAGEGWLEMPASNSVPSANMEASPAKKRLMAPPSPGIAKEKYESAEELVTRSPRRVRRETGGLREVREIIRRELELQD